MSMNSIKQQSVFSPEQFKKLGKTKAVKGAKTYGDIACVAQGEEVTMFVAPLSVNNAWKGKRFKTKDYINYQAAMLKALPKYSVPEGLLSIQLTFGFSSTLSDFDNPVKPGVDILQKAYKFNDRMIREALIRVEIVEKGKEFFKFKIEKYVDNKSNDKH